MTINKDFEEFLKLRNTGNVVDNLEDKKSVFTSIVNHCICPVELIKGAILSARSLAIDAVKFGGGGYQNEQNTTG